MYDIVKVRQVRKNLRSPQMKSAAVASKVHQKRLNAR